MDSALSALGTRVQAARNSLERQIGAARGLAQEGKSLESSIRTLEESSERCAKVSALLSSIGENRQRETQRSLESLVTQGLRAVFDSNLSFKIEESVKGKTPVVDFVVCTEADDGSSFETSVLEARGGGMAAVIGFLLRLVVVLLTKGRVRPVLFLDETFGHVSAEYEPALAQFIKDVATSTNVQIVLVTHSDAFSEGADKKYRFSLNGKGWTEVKEL